MFFEAGVLMHVLERVRRDHEFKRAVVDHMAGNSPPSAMERLMNLPRSMPGLTRRWWAGWRETSLYTAQWLWLSAPGGRWGSPPT